LKRAIERTAPEAIPTKVETMKWLKQASHFRATISSLGTVVDVLSKIVDFDFADSIIINNNKRFVFLYRENSQSASILEPEAITEPMKEI
jgi:hypothetical protein